MKAIFNKRPSGASTATKPPVTATGGKPPHQLKGATPGGSAGVPKGPPPSFKDTPTGERQELFIRKLRLCAEPMDWGNDGLKTERDIKRLNLLEIMDYINTTKGVFNESTFEDIKTMIANNLFRSLAPTSSNHAQYDEDEEPVLEASWPHLQYVYEFLLRFVVSNETDPKVVKRYITQDFLVRLLDLFESEDPRERDYLKTILHRIYGKFMPYRAFIRKSINSIFYRFIYETESHNGIAELLEILGSIINGFALPLKDEHKTFLMKALLPLHKVRNVSMYHQQLSYCVTQFVEKDPTLAGAVLSHLLEYWPCTFSAKELLFLSEVEEILEMVHEALFQEFFTSEYGEVNKHLFHRIALCVGSPHFQVAERALYLWNNEYIVSLIAQQRDKVLYIVFEALYTNSRTHWNSTVQGLTCNVVKLFMEMDSKLFDQCSAKYSEDLEKEKAETETKKATLAEITELAKNSPLYPALQDRLQPKSQLAYALRVQSVKKGQTMFDDEPLSEGIDGLAQGFGEISVSTTPTTEALRRKSILPAKKKADGA